MFMRVLPYLLTLASVLGILGYFYWKGVEDTKRATEVSSLKTTIEQQEDLNEIRNNRPDDAALYDRLLGGTF